MSIDRRGAPVEPTQEQIDTYRRDGFLVVSDFLPVDELERVREAFHDVFEHRWETGLAPDEVNYHPGVTPPDRTRQMCNGWKADRTLAATTLSARNGRWGTILSGEPGMRIIQDNMVWKPPGGKALLAHQDAAYQGYLVPANMTSCWMALDDTHADTGTVYYARGSNHWPRSTAGGQFHAPDDWLGYARSVVEPELFDAAEWVPIEVPAGGAAFHDGWCWHGSPPNERLDRERRAIVSHMISTATRWHPTERHSLYSRYMRPGELDLDEAFYPILWRTDGYRTPAIDAHFVAAGA
jgi:ectoine hydroxylase-related dioxygenase (phytanoyl-CoA dioxygenase family)